MNFVQPQQEFAPDSTGLARNFMEIASKIQNEQMATNTKITKFTQNKDMDHAYFEDLFRFDFEANELWSNFIFEQEQEFPEMNRLMSHLLNAHHLWIRRVRGEEVESGVWDTFEARHFVRLNHQNFSETLDYLERVREFQPVSYIGSDQNRYEIASDQLLYHILHHSAHHRGQLALLASQHNLQNRPVHNFVSYAAKG